MRFLLISDTHGKLGIINDLATRTRADAVIHAGDFGFYDESSCARLSDRELRLLVIHSGLQKEEKDRMLSLSRSERVAAAREHRLTGEFQSYIDSTATFAVPVYSVWGNHEDKSVVERIFRGDLSVRNLHVLHHRQAFRVGPALLYGLGGNFLPSGKLMDAPIAGGGGKLWSTLSQYADLVRTTEEHPEGQLLRLLVTHVSPGKESFVELIAARTRTDFTISGHMGAPQCMVWNPFAVRTADEAVEAFHVILKTVRAACRGVAGANCEKVDEELEFIGRLPEDTVHLGRGVKAPRWYRAMTHINLPDAHIGHAILDVEGGRARLQTFVN